MQVKRKCTWTKTRPKWMCTERWRKKETKQYAYSESSMDSGNQWMSLQRSTSVKKRVGTGYGKCTAIMKGTSYKKVESPYGNHVNSIIDVNNPERPVYTECRRGSTALIENWGRSRLGLQSHSGMTPLLSMREVSLGSSQCCCHVHAAQCKRAVKRKDDYFQMFANIFSTTESISFTISFHFWSMSIRVQDPFTPRVCVHVNACVSDAAPV